MDILSIFLSETIGQEVIESGLTGKTSYAAYDRWKGDDHRWQKSYALWKTLKITLKLLESMQTYNLGKIKGH